MSNDNFETLLPPESRDYISKLKNTKTFQSGLISIEKYQSANDSKWWFLLPPLPRSNKEYHVIAIKLQGKHPSMIEILSEDKDKIQVGIRDADKLYFVYVNRKLMTLHIPSPESKYRLGGGLLIDLTFDIDYCVMNAKEFWGLQQDPLAILEYMAIDRAQKYLMTVDGLKLISHPLELKKEVERSIEDSSSMKIIKEELESDIKGTILGGIKIEQVRANFSLNSIQEEFLVKYQDDLYNQHGLLRRKYINERINTDKTYHPYNLLDVIRLLDMSLLENFYALSWSDAMIKVHQAFNEEKRKYKAQREELYSKKIERLEKAIESITKLGLQKEKEDPQESSELRSQLAQTWKAYAQLEDIKPWLTDSEFLRLKIGLATDPQLLSDSATNQLE